MSDQELKQILYGRTEKVNLADGNEYTLREPSIDALVTLDINLATDINDVKTVRKLAYVLLKEDNPKLTEKELGKLITLSMLYEGTPFMESVKKVIGNGGAEKNGGSRTQ